MTDAETLQPRQSSVAIITSPVACQGRFLNRHQRRTLARRACIESDCPHRLPHAPTQGPLPGTTCRTPGWTACVGRWGPGRDRAKPVHCVQVPTP